MTATLSPQNNVIRAACWLLLGIAGGLCLDLSAKEILITYSLQEFVLVRSIIALLILAVLAPRFFGGWRALRTAQWRWHGLRTLLAIGAMYGFFYGLSQMPLVNALTLAFVAPLMVTALSVPFLGEQVGARRWIAVSVGFIGVLIILRPGVEEFSFAAIAVLFAAFCYAAQAITARHLGSSETLLSLAAWVLVGPLLLSLILLDERTWLTPDTRGWVLLTVAGICSVIAWVGLIRGYSSASPAVLAPLEYSALIGGAIAGYLIWGEVPDIWVIVGALVIIGSGLYVVYREVTLLKSDPDAT